MTPVRIPQSWRVIYQVLLLIVAFAACRPASPAAETVRPKLATPFVGEAEAWAMLFQTMGRLREAVARHELALIDPEDRFASSAVSVLIAELMERPSPENAALKMKWIDFVRSVSALHTAADRGRADQTVILMTKVGEKFDELQKAADPEVLEAARKLAERYTCPMHPDVIGGKNDKCPKCGMALDQPVVVLPVYMARGNLAAPQTVVATISTDAPLEPGKLARAVLHLRRAMDHPVTLEQLIETHTKKIHLLIVDGSLIDYHHEHPQPTDVPGDYAFEFTPKKPGPYSAWADLRPLPMGLQEYDKTIIPGTGEAEPISDKQTRLAADAEGLHFELTIAAEQVKAGQPVAAKLIVTRQGKGFEQLEPVMGAFAHLVGFNEDGETVLHMHPTGAVELKDTDRGGPMLEFKIFATKPGFTRLFAQVQIAGRQVFAPFGFQVVK